MTTKTPQEEVKNTLQEKEKKPESKRARRTRIVFGIVIVIAFVLFFISRFIKC